ncbi:hypothetical protein [uncultured Fluviicola sp.]|uniref:hypothetical protein n=1 Tax=uncultured Fluviicola sp. TaxID=463303 RepID=UPI0025F9B029|nr:hypothetical protein [uncultured Fluviicola sp.]
MKKALFLLGMLVSICSYGQFNHIQYKKDCDVAYRLAIDDSNYSKSLNQLSKVKKQYGKLYSEEYILMAHCYKKQGKETKSAKCLRSAWSNYGFDMACFGQVKQIDLGEINKDYTAKQQKLVQQGFDNFAKLKRSNTDSLMLVLQTMLEADQVPRMKFYSDTPIDTIAVNREMALTDSINLIAFKNIIYKLGYPGEWILPGNSSQVFVLLVHSSYNQAFFDEMKDVLLKEVIAGRMPPSHYAIWLDRHYSVTDLPQSYGMLAVPENLNLSEKQKQEITTERLKIGLIKNCPIPTQLLMFE